MNWQDRVAKRLCGLDLSPGATHLAVYAAFVDASTSSPRLCHGFTGDFPRGGATSLSLLKCSCSQH